MSGIYTYTYYVVEDDTGAFWIVGEDDLLMGMPVLFSAKSYLECEAWIEVQPSN